uniref:FH2 domain-containing protein n=1 Tax=Heterorhabditis bacteriophora TaxID=37862 RepID=A0A1I7XQ52_HETBA
MMDLTITVQFTHSTDASISDLDASDLNIRVKDRSGDDVVTTAKRNRIGGLFKETPIKGLLKESAADTLKRPLTGVCSTLDERSLSPEVNLSLPRTEFDAIARAPHLSASQLHGMLQVDIFASKHPQLAKIDDLGRLFT